MPDKDRLQKLTFQNGELKQKEFATHAITLFSRMEFPNLINWTSPFPFYGLMLLFFHFLPNFSRIFCKQIVKTLIRCSVLRFAYVSQKGR